MSDVVVRRFDAGDVGAVAAALVEVHRTDGYPVEGVGAPEAWVRPEGVVEAWVAEAGGRIVGHVAVVEPHGEDAVAGGERRAGGADRGRGAAVRCP